MAYIIATFYKFTSLEQDKLPSLRTQLQEKGNQLGLFGLTLIAPEGINATVVGQQQNMEIYKEFLQQQFGELTFKDSVSDSIPFKRFKVKIKEEIVQLKRTDITPTGRESHLSPEEWDELVKSQEAVLIDVRNWYEVKLGTFKKAVNPQTKHFSQFPDWLKSSGIKKDAKIGIFCTGGIRCEKAAVAMKEQGYEEVHQLDGGVLNYIEKRPGQNFEGECFVFDGRSAVGQDLRPSKVYAVCSGCGNGGSLQETCAYCGKLYRTCDDCLQAQKASLCSKNCRYIYQQQ